MSVEIVIIFGVMVGFIASKVRGSGFGLWWDIYLGVAGSAFASCLMISGYFLNVFVNRDVAGINLYSIIVDITGALALIYAARFYHGAIMLSKRGKPVPVVVGHNLSRIRFKQHALGFFHG